MKFISEVINYNSNSKNLEEHKARHWYSRIYKITYYHHNELNCKPAYAAYYKPKGWKNWGMAVQKDTMYHTLNEAIQACINYEASRHQPGYRERLC